MAYLTRDKQNERWYVLQMLPFKNTTIVFDDPIVWVYKVKIVKVEWFLLWSYYNYKPSNLE